MEMAYLNKNDPYRSYSRYNYYTIYTSLNVTDISNVINLISKTDYSVTILQNKSGKVYFPNLETLNIWEVSTGVCILTLSIEDLLAEYRKKRRLLMVKLCDSFMLVTDEYRISFLTSVLKGLDNCERQTRSRFVDIGLTTGTKYLPQRPIHHTTPEPLDDEYLGRKCNVNQFALPYDNEQYENPLMRAEEHIKAPIQVSDVSVDTYSFQTSYPYSGQHVTGNIQGNATIVTNVTPFQKLSQSGTNYSNLKGNSAGREYVPGEQASNSSRSNASSNIPRRRRGPRYPEYVNAHSRLQSFMDHRWNELERPMAQDLVDWGLFCTGRDDLVRCYQCGLGLKDWIKEDDPLCEHVKHSEDCEFLLQALGEDQYRSLKESIEQPENNDSTGTQQHNGNGSSNSVSGHANVRHPRYQTMEDRLKTFDNNFPRYITQTSRQLAVAGFFFTGKADICRCFSCDLGLKDWTPGDDPLEEHAKYLPDCTYLRQLKGESFIQLVAGRHATGANLVSSTQTAAPNNDYKNRNTTVTNTREELTPGSGKGQIQQATGDTNVLLSSGARTVLAMGYSEDVVRNTVRQLNAKGNSKPNAQDILEHILDYEDDVLAIEQLQVHDESHNIKDANQLLNENETLKDNMLCMECHAEERNILFLPCAHHCVCEKCSRRIGYCPKCERRIQERIKTYMS